MKLEELRLLQNYPLELKIAKSKARIQEFINHFGVEGVYISFSGGKDSTVLLHLVRSLYPNVEAVFSNTGLEFPEITKFVKTKENVTMVKPEKSFAQVIKDCGYPIISKKTARMIRDCQNPTEKNKVSRQLYLSDYAIKNGELTDIKNNSFKIAKKWRYLIDSDIPISHKCCDILKKNPMKKYEKESKKRPIIGTMANESKMRESSYLTRGGCNSFDEKKGSCLPLSFWTEQDIFEYILKYNLEYASVYGDIVKDENNKWTTTGEKRTGCYACGFFRTKDQLKERLDRMSETHPQLYNYCLKGGKHDEKGKWIPEQGLGYKHLLDILDIECR